MQTRIEKSIARLLTVKFAPECGEVLSLFRSKRDGWIKMPEEFELVRKNSGLGDIYVIAYEAEPRILSCLMKSICPDDTVKKFKEFDDELIAANEDEKLELVTQLLDELDNDEHFKTVSDFAENTSEEDIEALKKEWDDLPEDVKTEVTRQIQLFCTFFYAYFYNHIALMVHGQKLTTLVPLAIKGDKKAFCKVVQIDRNLLTGHSYFRDTYARLQIGEDPNFLDAVSKHINRPPIQGRIRFPTLYMLFAILDGFGRLDDFSASEILDMCDEAGLDRYQNRIEDETYVVKRRIEYRKKQKIGF